MHTAKPQPNYRSIIGHPSIFPDGVYTCMGSYGMNKERAELMAEAMAKRYHSKTLVTEKKVRVRGEGGTVMKSLYLIWERRK